MKNPFASKDYSESTRRRIELAVAVAQERLLSTHVDHALELVELVGDRVPFDTALDIYTRLLRLSDDEARVITTRVLATLGERAEEERAWPEPPEPPPAREEERSARSFLEQFRNRLRGRVNEELRRWIEMEAARTEVALLETHVENALNFVELLRDQGTSMGEAIELYLDALDVRDSIAEVTYYTALARLSEQHLPRRRARAEKASGRPVRAGAAEERRLRVVESDGS